MNKTGPIIIVDDDADDALLFRTCLRNLEIDNEIHTFSSGERALEFLLNSDERPFLIFLDIIMPRMAGYEVRDQIFTDPRLEDKIAPCIFITSASVRSHEPESRYKVIQGLFQKPATIDALQKNLACTLEYWSMSM